MKQIEVQIMQQSYLLTCPEGQEARLLASVQRLDDAMSNIRDSGKVRSRDRVAVLAALNMSFDVSERVDLQAQLQASQALAEQLQTQMQEEAAAASQLRSAFQAQIEQLQAQVQEQSSAAALLQASQIEVEQLQAQLQEQAASAALQPSGESLSPEVSAEEFAELQRQSQLADQLILKLDQALTEDARLI